MVLSFLSKRDLYPKPKKKLNLILSLIKKVALLPLHTKMFRELADGSELSLDSAVPPTDLLVEKCP